MGIPAGQPWMDFPPSEGDGDGSGWEPGVLPPRLVSDLDRPPSYCADCGAEVYPLKGGGVLTCRRGHHQTDHWGLS